MLQKDNTVKIVKLDRTKKSALIMTESELNAQIDFERCEKFRNRISKRIMNTPLTIFK